MIDRIKGALTRKIGPLPAWAWLAIVAAVAYYWQRRNGGTGSAGGDTSGSVQDNTGSDNPPVVLGPGESAYDPNTGALVSGGALPADPQSPLTLEPGEAAFNPATGELVTNNPPDKAANSGKSTATKAKTNKKRAAKVRHLLSELRHAGAHSPAHIRHVRRELAGMGVKVPRTKHKTPKKHTHPSNARSHSHKPQHAHHPSSAPHRPRSAPTIRHQARHTTHTTHATPRKRVHRKR